MAGKGPRLENCSFAYHCDDCVNISGYYAVVTEAEGKTARILYKGKTRYGKLLFAGDTLEIMTPEGESKPEHPKLLAVRDDAPQTPSELAWLKTLKLWPGQAEVCTDGARVELGYVIHPAYQNQGYATEALTAGIDALFQAGISTVETGAFEENSASMRVMEKSGMHRIPRTDQIDYRGNTHTCVYYQKNAKNR